MTPPKPGPAITAAGCALVVALVVVGWLAAGVGLALAVRGYRLVAP